jgi:beta-glucosidase
LVLLRNETVDGAPFLPLDPLRPRRLAVVGPNADDPLSQLGDWSLGSGQMVGPSGPQHPRESVVTIADGLRSLLPPGWTLTHPDEADLLVAVVGDRLAYIGETKSTATLELQDGQVEFLGALARRGKPWVGVLVCSKPLVLPQALAQAPGLFCLFNPGMLGGQAFAEALWGSLNPQGHLPISFPRHVGQQPVYYNAVRGQHGPSYADLPEGPAFAFGQGLSYTRWCLGTPVLEQAQVTLGQVVRVTVEVENLGPWDGAHVVQLYVEDEVCSATWARRELKAYRKVAVKAGERASVILEVDTQDLWIIDAEGRKVVEPGTFRVLVGTSSRDQDLAELRVTLSTDAPPRPPRSAESTPRR